MTCQSGQPLSEEGRKAVNATSVGRGRGGITNKERRRWEEMGWRNRQLGVECECTCIRG